MKRNIFAIGAMLMLLVSACAPQSTPTANSADIAGTAQAAAFTIVAQTQQAIPTATPVPPTETPSPTSVPTDTPPPLPTLSTPSALATGIPSFTPQPAQGSAENQDPCNRTLGSWAGPTTNFTIVHDYKPQSKDDKVVVSLWVSSEMGECGYLANLSSGPVGQYSAFAFVDGKQHFQVSGGFRLTEGKWKIIIRNDSIIAQGGCYPNC